MENLIWVKIETNKSNDDIWCLKGQILSAVFESIISNQLTSGYFKLNKVYWIDKNYDGAEVDEKLYQYGRGDLKAYKGELFFRIEHLISIAPIDGEMELSKFNANDKKHLSLVSPIRS